MPTVQRTLDATSSGTFSIVGVNNNSPHTQITMRFLDINSNVVTPNGGTFSVIVRPNGSDQFQSVQAGTDITATDPLDSLTYTAIGVEIKYEPTGIIGADRIIFTVGSTNA